MVRVRELKTHPGSTRGPVTGGTPPRQPRSKAIRLHSQDVGSTPVLQLSDFRWTVEGRSSRSVPGCQETLLWLAFVPAHYLDRPLPGLPIGNAEKVTVLRDNVCNSHPVLITWRVRCSLSSGSRHETPSGADSQNPHSQPIRPDLDAQRLIFCALRFPSQLST